MRQVNMYEGKTHRSRLVEDATAGDGFLIYKAGKPMVRVTSIEASESATPSRRPLGLLNGQCSVPDNFDQLASDTIADLFEGA